MKQKSSKSSNLFYECKKCDYNTSRKSNFTKHLTTAKHQNGTNVTEKVAKVATPYNCKYCYHPYNSRTGLWRHQKECSREEHNKLGLILEQTNELIKENQELKKNQQDLTNKVVDICTHMQTTVTNNLTHNSNNKTFNLNFFLNETCKNAISLTDFVSSIQLQLEDLEDTGQLGYVNGISNIIINNLNKLETTDRPVHCTDNKREIIYVKDELSWLKDKNKEKLTEAITNISRKNMRNIIPWKEKNPECVQYNSKKNDEYLRIISNSVSGGSAEEINKNVNKIISNIAKEVLVER